MELHLRTQKVGGEKKHILDHYASAGSPFIWLLQIKTTMVTGFYQIFQRGTFQVAWGQLSS